MRDSWSHDARVGHLVKSRAAINDIIDNRLTGQGGTDSYGLDLPNGGRSRHTTFVSQRTARLSRNCLSHDPRFVSRKTYGYRLRPGSPCRGRGAPASVAAPPR